MRSNTSKTMSIITVLGLLSTLAGCAATEGARMTPDEAKQEAVAFLRESMLHERLDWPDVPEPVATRCAGGAEGVRFEYMATADANVDPERLARSYEHFWRSKGLNVRPAEEDFGEYGTLYGATARADGKPWGAFEFSRKGVNLYAYSQCVSGSPSDYDG